MAGAQQQACNHLRRQLERSPKPNYSTGFAISSPAASGSRRARNVAFRFALPNRSSSTNWAARSVFFYGSTRDPSGRYQAKSLTRINLSCLLSQGCSCRKTKLKSVENFSARTSHAVAVTRGPPPAGGGPFGVPKSLKPPSCAHARYAIMNTLGFSPLRPIVGLSSR
jgi:hypothetical protein